MSSDQKGDIICTGRRTVSCVGSVSAELGEMVVQPLLHVGPAFLEVAFGGSGEEKSERSFASLHPPGDEVTSRGCKII